jgi:hypothetical protein
VRFCTDACVAFLKKQAVSVGLPLQIYFVVPGKPIVVLTWEGSEPALPSVLLNSHMDVVPVFPVSSALIRTRLLVVVSQGVKNEITLCNKLSQRFGFQD